MESQPVGGCELNDLHQAIQAEARVRVAELGQVGLPHPWPVNGRCRRMRTAGGSAIALTSEVSGAALPGLRAGQELSERFFSSGQVLSQPSCLKS